MFVDENRRSQPRVQSGLLDVMAEGQKTAKVILSVDEFLEKLKVGDKFWYMTSWLEKPDSVEGPCTILELFQNDEGDWLIHFRNERSGYATNRRSYGSPRHVADLTNSWHGTFLSKEDANAYFEERKLAYETDPVLIREHEEAVEFARMEDEYADAFWTSEEEVDG